MAIGKISGLMLQSNLERQGVPLSFEGNLLYIDVNALKIGIKNTSPEYELDVTGTVRANSYIGVSTTLSGNITAGNVVVSGAVIAGNTTVSSIDANGSVTGITGSFTGNVVSGNLYSGSSTISGPSTVNSLIVNTAATVGGNLSVTGNTSLTGNLIVSDAKFYIVDDIDPTKKAQFQLSGITSGITRTYTLPDSSSTLVDLATTQTITAVKTFSATTQNIGSSTATSTINLGYGATTDGESKTVLLGVAGQAGSYTQVHIGSNVSGATGNVIINHYTNFSNNVSFAGNVNGSGTAAYAGGLQNTAIGNVAPNTGSFTNLTSNGITTITSNIESTSYTTGSFIVTGGAGISGNLNVNGAITTSNLVVNGGDLTNVNIGNITFSNTTITTKLTNGNITISPTGAGIVYVTGTAALSIPAGTTAQEPATAPVGSIRYNTDSESLEFFNGTDWVPTTALISVQNITPDGVSNSYSLNKTTTASGIIVNLNGVIQRPDYAYSVSGTQITFTEIPQATDLIEIRYLSTGTAAPSTGSLALISNIAPAHSNSTGAKGQVAYDSSYLYICVDTNTWVRAAITTSW